MSILADWMLLFCYLIINGMNVNIGRSDVIILLLNYKWDECESCISLEGIILPPNYKWDECEY